MIHQELIQIITPLEVGITRESYIKQVFDIATARGDKVAVSQRDDCTSISWSNGFGMVSNEPLNTEEQAYHAAHVYNTTLNLGIAKPNIS